MRTLIKVTDDCLLDAAATLARCFPELVEPLRTRHVPGPDGRCRGCLSSAQLAPRWPCGPRALADLALRFQE